MLNKPEKQLFARYSGPAIETEREFVQVIGKAALSNDSLECAKQPSLKQRGDEVRQGKLLRIFEYFMLITFGREATINLPNISDNRTNRRHRILNKTFHGNRSKVWEGSQTNSLYSLETLVFNSKSTGNFFPCSVPSFSCFILFFNVGLVYLHNPSQSLTTWANPCTAHFMKLLQCRLVASKPKRSLKPGSFGTIFLVGYVPHRPKPDGQKTSDSIKNSAGYHRGMPIVCSAMPEPTSGQPSIDAATLRTNPMKLGQVSEAVFLGSKLCLKFRQRLWVIFYLHNAGRYMLWLLESSRHPNYVYFQKDGYNFAGSLCWEEDQKWK
jgi:hypothetical protein